MTLKEQLKIDLKNSMRNKEIVKRDCIRAINTMIKQVEVDERIELDDKAIVKLIQKGIKQRLEAIVQYEKASREDLVQKEQEQIDVFSLYLPKQLNEEELKAKLEEIMKKNDITSKKEIGKIMGIASKELAGTVDGKRISEMVKNLLV